MNIFFELNEKQLKLENPNKEDLAFLVDIYEGIQYSISFEKYIFSVVSTGLFVMSGEASVHPLLAIIIKKKSSLKKKHREIIDSFLNAGSEGSILLLQKLKPLFDCYEIKMTHAREYHRHRCGRDSTMGGRLYTERKTSNISIQKAADICEISTKQYKQWENDEAEPPLSALKILHKHYGFDLNYVVGEDGAIISTSIAW